MFTGRKDFGLTMTGFGMACKQLGKVGLSQSHVGTGFTETNGLLADIGLTHYTIGPY